MDSVVDYLRIINGLLGMSCFVMLVARVLFAWRRFDLAQKLYFSSLLLFCLGTVYGSFELVLDNDNKFSFRVIFTFLAELLLFCYLLEPRSSYEHRLGKDPLPKRFRK